MAHGHAKPTKAHEVARQYMRKNPQVTTKLTIAKHLVKLRPKLFPSVEHARGIVRYIAGQRGEKSRAKLKDKSQVLPPGTQSDSVIKIPKGISEFREPLDIQGPCKVLIMGDLHIPYHDERAVETAINYGLKHGCDTLYLNGDIGDFYAASRFDKDPENRSLDAEIETMEEILDTIGKPFQRKVFKVGNHDDRWQLYLWRNAPALGKVAKLRLDAILELKEKGYEFVQTKQWSNIGKLALFHGHEIQGASAVNPARGAYMKITNTAAVNHHHRTSQHVETQSLTQQMIVAWSMGCMCDRRPAYAVINKWNLGFGICEVAANGDFEFSNLRIDDGRGYKVDR